MIAAATGLPRQGERHCRRLDQGYRPTGIPPRRLCRQCGASVVTARSAVMNRRIPMNLTDTGTEQGTDLAGNTPSQRTPARRKSRASNKAPKQPARRTRIVSKQAGVIEMLRRRMAGTFGTWLPGRGRTQEARLVARIREEWRRAPLPHRRWQSLDEEQRQIGSQAA